jgi:hypothetical protein
LGADVKYTIPGGTMLPVALHLPYSANGGGPIVIPAGTTLGAAGVTLVGLRRYSSPLCDPMTGTGCPSDGVPVFSNIFAQDTVANSNYNSLQVLVEKRYAHGLQLQGAYTYSKSIDNASSFENSLNPLNFRFTRGVSLFDARHRFVFSYYWEIPIPKKQGLSGKFLNGWGTSGIVTAQAGFPIRITTGNSLESIDNELFSSSAFEPVGVPNILMPFRTQDPRTHNNLAFDPALFTANIPLGSTGNSPRTVCCGPGISNIDLTILKSTALGERVKMEFRTEFYNLFNHTQFIGVQGDISQGIQFGKVLRARDPRLIQFALRFSF